MATLQTWVTNLAAGPTALAKWNISPPATRGSPQTFLLDNVMTHELDTASEAELEASASGSDHQAELLASRRVLLFWDSKWCDTENL